MLNLNITGLLLHIKLLPLFRPAGIAAVPEDQQPPWYARATERLLSATTTTITKPQTTKITDCLSVGTLMCVDVLGWGSRSSSPLRQQHCTLGETGGFFLSILYRLLFYFKKGVSKRNTQVLYKSRMYAESICLYHCINKRLKNSNDFFKKWQGENCANVNTQKVPLKNDSVVTIYLLSWYAGPEGRLLRELK